MKIIFLHYHITYLSKNKIEEMKINYLINKIIFENYIINIKFK